jgi:hypothetical protein
MNYLRLLFSLLAMCLLAGAAPETHPVTIPACEAEKFCTQCVNQLPSDFSFVKSYELNGDGGNKRKLEYSYVFTKGTLYRLNICSAVEGSTDGIIVILYDSKRNAIASNLAGKDMASSLTYSCNATGVYFIQFVFDKSATFCGGSALGFKRE